jgi:hypothetical protein
MYQTIKKSFKSQLKITIQIKKILYNSLTNTTKQKNYRNNKKILLFKYIFY